MVTTVSIVLVTIGISVALIYLIRILRDANKVSQVVRNEGEEIIGGITKAREEITEKGFDLFSIAKTMMGLITKKKRTRKK